MFFFGNIETTSVSRRDFGRRTTFLWERLKSTITFPLFYVLTWFRLLLVSFLLKIKQTNDAVLNRMQQKPFLAVLPQRLLIHAGAIIEYLAERLRPNDGTRVQRKKQPTTSTRNVQQKQYVSRYGKSFFITKKSKNCFHFFF